MWELHKCHDLLKQGWQPVAIACLLIRWAQRAVEPCSSNMEHRFEEANGRDAPRRRKAKIAFVIIVVIVLIVAAFLIGFFVKSSSTTDEDVCPTGAPGAASSSIYHKQFQESIDAKKIEENLR